jgi:hypothetical protein
MTDRQARAPWRSCLTNKCVCCGGAQASHSYTTPCNALLPSLCLSLSAAVAFNRLPAAGLSQAAIPEAFFAVAVGLEEKPERCDIYRVQLDQLDDWVSTYEKWDAPDAKQSDADMALPASCVLGMPFITAFMRTVHHELPWVPQGAD